jgi:hypothetical protein
MNIFKRLRRVFSGRRPAPCSAPRQKPEPTRLNTIYSNSEPGAVGWLNSWLDHVEDKHHGDFMGHDL